MIQTSVQCFRAVRADRRANDLTVEALLRDVATSAGSTFSLAVSAVVGWYVAYDKRQQRRRHHYRRAMNAVSVTRLATPTVEVSALPAVTSRKPATAPFIHIVGREAKSLPNAMKALPQAKLANLPPAHVCADAARREDCSAAS